MTTEAVELEREIEVGFEELPTLHYHRSAALGKLVAALCKAQLEFDKVRKEAENEAFKRNGKASKYATLDAVIGATREALAKNELVIIALPDSLGADGKLRLTSVLMHSSEQFIQSTLTMSAVDKLTPQQVGTMLTYGRRYQWLGLTGTAPEDDDDGNLSSGQGSRQEAQDVAKRKIAELEAKKAEKAPQQAPALVSSLFYTLPEKHNGNYADFYNLKSYVESHPDQADALRLLFTRYMSKQLARSGAVMVPAERLQELLGTLAGDMAIDVKKLEAQ